ncbi:hypothetical protein JTE90_015541, partial [Oedothorax gibbosus]
MKKTWDDRKAILDFLILIGIFSDVSPKCDKCDRDMALKPFDNKGKGDGFHWICRTADHTCKRSIRKDTWMEGSHLPSITIIRLNYEWIRRVPAQGVLDDLGLAKQTVTDWFSFCRE